MLKGIDVSRHQSSIDWAKVKSSGIDVAIIRTSYGMKQTDDKAIYNIEEALKNGIEIGVYHFVYADSKEEVEKNAEKFYSVCKPYLNKIKFGCWCDWEYDTDKRNGNKFNKDQRTELVKVFCEKCKALGMPNVGVYANPDYLLTKFGNLTEYPLWIAKYGKKPSTSQWKFIMWQYSSKGNVSGIKGNVDLDEVYTGEDAKTDVPTYIQNRRVLKLTTPYMSGSDVIHCQKILKSLGYDIGSTGVDSKYGKMTEKAVRAFQRDKSLVVDGMVGIRTWAMLEKYNEM